MERPGKQRKLCTHSDETARGRARRGLVLIGPKAPGACRLGHAEQADRVRLDQGEPRETVHGIEPASQMRGWPHLGILVVTAHARAIVKTCGWFDAGSSLLGVGPASRPPVSSLRNDVSGTHP